MSDEIENRFLTEAARRITGFQKKIAEHIRAHGKISKIGTVWKVEITKSLAGRKFRNPVRLSGASEAAVVAKAEKRLLQQASRRQPSGVPLMIPVKSSNIRSVGYEPNKRDLYVEFKHGGTYAYHKVPERVALDLLEAPSHGQYLDRSIKSRFDYSKID